MIVIFYSLWYFIFLIHTIYSSIKNFFLKKGIFPKINYFITPKNFNSLSLLERFILILFYRPGTKIFRKYELYIIDLFSALIIRKTRYPLVWQFFISYHGVNYLTDLNFNRVKKIKKLILRKKSLIKSTIFLSNFFFKKDNLKNSVNFFFLLSLAFKLNPLVSSNFIATLKKNNKLLFKNRYVILGEGFKIFLLNIFNKKILKNIPNYKDLYNKPTSISNDLSLEQKVTKINSKNEFFLKKKLYFFRKMHIFFKSHNFTFSEINYFWRTTVKDFFYINKTILLETNWFSNLKKLWIIRISPSTTSKLMSEITTKDQIIFYIRKNRIFNKGRYSRNRQLYRTGVYWCIWLSILLAYGLYFVLYRFTINFGYFWWTTFIGLSLFLFNRSLKYRHYSLRYFVIDLKKNLAWLKIIIYSLIISKKDFLNFFLKKILVFKENSSILNNHINFFLFFINFFKSKKHNRIVYNNYYVQDYLFINFSKEL